MAIAFAMAPQLAEAGPCGAGIADFEGAMRLYGGHPQGSQRRQTLRAQPDRQPAPDLASRLQTQFSATMARSKRLDREGDRFGCIGALNAARRMYVLVDKQ
jgi:hypothetical protein